MNNRDSASRYSKVLFNLDIQNHIDLEKRLSDFESLVRLFKTIPNFLHVFKSPQIDLEEKKELLKTALNGDFDPHYLDFLFYLIDKKKLNNLEQIAADYRSKVNQALGISEIKVMTAIPLSADSEAHLKEKLEKELKSKVKFNKEVDPKLIGGLILVMGNKMVDWSVAERLKKMKEIMK
jgi:F-type H+-transporting ATPase subunit delta